MIAPSSRFLAALATWLLLFLAGPGILGRDGAGILALVALVPWAITACRPGKHAFLAEWAAAGVGNALMSIWSAYVWSGTLAFLALVPGLYVACAGALLRLLARRFPLAIAAPAAWVALEVLRVLVEPPFGYGWMRVGTSFHAIEWLAGSARVWGTFGLSFVAAAAAGGIGDALRRRKHWARRTRSPRVSAFFGAAPLAAAIALSLATQAPATVPGPSVLLVQPAFEQHRKMESRDWRELAEESIALTARGVAEAGAPEPDLVAWGETMFPFPMAEPGLAAAFEAGARPPPWARDQLQLQWIENMERVERDWIQGRLLGEKGVLPGGTSFLTGVEHHALAGGVIRRQNALILYGPDGRRTGVGGKVHLVPGAENLCGLERVGFVRSLVESIAGYVPDLLAFDRAQVFTLRTRDGREFRFGTSVCFDNAYDDPYTVPLREGKLDFHLVCSNEAWYETSFEYDQMIAFSRLLAIQTGRSFVRATNAGISIVLDPAGREVARLEAIPAAGGSSSKGDRMVPGTLRAIVPVPDPAAAESRTVYVRFESAWLAFFLGLPLLLGFFVVRGGYTAFERG